MNEERLWLLLSLQLSGEATPEELTELEALLQQHPELDAKAKLVAGLWQKNALKPAEGNTSAYDRHLQRLSNQLTAPALQWESTAEGAEEESEENIVSINRKSRRWYWVAACAAGIIVLVGAIMMNSNKVGKPARLAENTVSTKAGSKSKIQLPDGTQVWLNADSKLEYNENFNGKLREVKLSGEAFFDVVKNKEKPFVIHTAQMDVKVLGTAFNVRSYPDETTSETALLRGAVEITLHSNPDKKYYLKPNDKLVLNNNVTALADSNTSTAITDNADKQLVKMKKVHIDTQENDITETMWVKNKLAFDNEPLEKILAETERWYNVHVELKNEKVKSFRFTSVFENKPLTDVLEALCLAAHLHYQVKGATVTIW